MKKNIFYLLSACLFVLDAENGFCQSRSFSQKVVQPKRYPEDVFGQFVVLHEDYAFISCWRDNFNENGNNFLNEAGAVYLYEKSSSGLWTFLKKIVASDRTSLDGFGYGLAMDSNTVLIGAPFEGFFDFESAGAFYVFENENGVFTEQQKLYAPDREYWDEFGWKLGVSGDWIIVGSPRDSEDENGENYIGFAGSAYLYHRIGDEWVFTQKILASDRGKVGDGFGQAVAISGDYAAVAGDGDDDAGHVYIFKNGGGVWTEVQKLSGNDASAFGRAIIMKGNRMLIGSGGTNSNGNEFAGSAYIFENIEGVWTKIQRIEASDGRETDFFGGSLDMDGDNIVVGATGNDYNVNNTDYCPGTGAAYLYQKNEAGMWGEIQKIVAPDRNPSLFEYYSQLFSIGVGISNGIILCGANLESFDENGDNYINDAGAAYFFQNPVLPLDVSALTGERKNNKNILYWQTYNETNVQNMVVERSTDGINFNKIGNIIPQHKAAAYQYEDTTAAAGVTNFYRISFHEKDGRNELSNTITIAANTNAFTVSVRPNPFTTKFSVVVNSGLKESTPMNVHWYNTAGRLVYTETRFLNSGDNTLTLNTAALAKGIYMVEFVLSDGRRRVEKVVRE